MILTDKSNIVFPRDFNDTMLESLQYDIFSFIAQADIMRQSDKYLMKVEDFDTNFVSSLNLLRDSEEFFDVTLVSDDEIQIQAHKVILSASSPFLRNVLKFNKNTCPLLYIRGATNSILSKLVEFIYKGEATVIKNDLDSFLKLAEDLKVTGLSEKDAVTRNIWNSMELKTNKDKRKKKNLDNTENTEQESSEEENQEYRETDEETQELSLDLKLENGKTNSEIVDIAGEAVEDKTTSELDAKISEMMEKENHMWHCKICKFSRPKKSHLQVHIEIHHLDFVHPCNFCEHTNKSRQSLFAHVKKFHSTTKL